MIIFVYDKTFEGLLTAVFDAYSRRTFPDLLVTEGEPFPLFYDEAIRIYTDDRKAERVWKGLEKKISKSSLSGLTVTCCYSDISAKRSMLQPRLSSILVTRTYWKRPRSGRK